MSRGRAVLHAYTRLQLLRQRRSQVVSSEFPQSVNLKVHLLAVFCLVVALGLVHCQDQLCCASVAVFAEPFMLARLKGDKAAPTYVWLVTDSPEEHSEHNTKWCGCLELNQLPGAAGERRLSVIVVVGTVRWVPLIPWFLSPLNSDCSGPCNTHSPMRDYGITKPPSLEKVKWNLMRWKQSKHLTPLRPAWFLFF